MTTVNQLRRVNYRHVLPDVLILVFSFYCSALLRLGFEDIQPFLPILNRTVLIWVGVRLAVFVVTGVYDIIWRYISLKDALQLVRSVALSSVVIIAATFIVNVERLPRAVFFIDFALATLLLAAIRFARRFLYDRKHGDVVQAQGRRTLIFGAGTNGRNLATRFETDSDSGFRLIGFIDDDFEKIGRFVAGVRVLGGLKELPELIRRYAIEEAVLAISKPPARLLREFVQICRKNSIRPRLVSSLFPQLGKRNDIRMLRDVALEDLLPRPSGGIEVKEVRSILEGRRVLVSGAGGSIGSELCRQIMTHRPSKLVLLDHGEFNLYQIDQELRTSYPESQVLAPRLVDIKCKELLENVFTEFKPQIVLHAAAYKHVHLVEQNPLAAILNNIQGTRNLVRLSVETGVERFVQISTDKAVNPAGVMGATKRVCELVVTRAGLATGRRFCSVRFGNVLGSSGSLIPLIAEQIQNGQPITITHPDMSRYFMLIPEALSLVLRAATLSSPGDIMLLRMGEPIRITDLAKNLIALMGKTEDEVPIIFTGARPGEKLFEELYYSGRELKTDDPNILIVPRGDRESDQPTSRDVWFDQILDEMVGLAEAGDQKARFILDSLVSLSGEGVDPSLRFSSEIPVGSTLSPELPN